MHLCYSNGFEVAMTRTHPGLLAIPIEKRRQRYVSTARVWWVIGLHCSGGKKLIVTLYMEHLRVSTLLVLIGYGYSQHRGLEWYTSHKGKYYVYFFPSDVWRKETITFEYGYCVKVAVSPWKIEAIWADAKLIERNLSVYEKVYNEGCENASLIGRYKCSAPILEEHFYVNLLLFSCFLVLLLVQLRCNKRFEFVKSWRLSPNQLPGSSTS